MTLHAIRSNRDAAGHSGAYRTVSRSATRLSSIARYSDSFESLVVLFFPDLGKSVDGLQLISHKYCSPVDEEHEDGSRASVRLVQAGLVQLHFLNA